MSRLIALPIAAALTLAACGKPVPKEDVAPPPAATPEAAAEPSTTADDWQSLDALVDRYPSETKLLEASAVTPALQKLLGRKFETLRTNMQTQAPLKREAGVLYTSGNKQHEGGVNMAYVLIAPATQAIEVGLWEAGKLTTYRTGDAELPKPKDIQTLMDNAAG